VSGGFDALFDLFTYSSFRYEGLPAYSVAEEAERIEAWRAGGPRPERSMRTSPWLRRVAVSTAEGKQWSRVRAVDRPLPEYLRYELAGYVENQAVGDRTYLVDRVDAWEGPDFWLFDGGTDDARAATMSYSPAGAFEGFELVTDHAALATLNDVRHRLLERATPLNVWLASLGGRGVA
jgi:hypothetical protein